MKRLFFAFLIALLFICSTFTSFSQTDGGPVFSAQLPIWVKNNSGTPVNNTQVRLVVNTQALISLGLMLPNGNDIRFANSCGVSPGTLYNYWIEGPMNATNTGIWVKIPAIPGNDSALIYMYFGNTSLGAGSTLSTFNGPHSSTDSVASGAPGGVGNSQRGFRFTANTNLLVTQFGKYEPTGTTRYVTLFDFTTQAVLRQKQVSGPSAQYVYDTLGSPIWLTSGTQYLIELYQGTSDGYYFGTSSQIGQHLTYGDMRYCNSCTQNTFPTSTLNGYHYGYPDFLYYVVDNPVSPAPTNNSGLPADTVTPTAPASLTGIAGNTTAQLRWNKNTQFDVWKYFVYRSTTNNPAGSTLIDSTTHPDTAYVATGLTNGTTYYFWVRAVDRFCSRRISPYSNVATVSPFVGIQTTGNEIPKVFALYQNFPNPFNPVTNINFDIPKVSMTRVTVYDILGKEIDVPVNQVLAAGKYNISFNADKLASGVYFYKIEAGNFIDKKKMIVVK